MVVKCSKLCLLKIPALGATPLSFLLHFTSGQSPPVITSVVPHHASHVRAVCALGIAIVSDTGRRGDSSTLNVGLTVETLSHVHQQEPLPGSSSLMPRIVWDSQSPYCGFFAV